MNIYIVRIYRCNKDDPHELVGIVEDADGRFRMVFTNLDELWEIITFSERE